MIPHTNNPAIPCARCGDLDGCHLPGKIRTNRLSLEEIWEQHAAWSRDTFGSDQERGPIGPLKHLAKEVQEALADPFDLEEYADLVFLIFDACRRAGFSLEQLRLALNEKLKVNRARQWPRNVAADQPTEHVR